MVDKSIIEIVKKYLTTLNNSGIPIQCGIIFGSQTVAKTNKWSDIDILVVSPIFDSGLSLERLGYGQNSR